MASVRGRGKPSAWSPYGNGRGGDKDGVETTFSLTLTELARDDRPPSRPGADLDGIPLQNHQDRQILQDAIRDLRKRDPRVKASALRALGRLKNRSVVPVLVDAFDERHDFVRAEIINALAEIAVPSVTALFKRALSHDESVAVRLAAVRGLYRLATIESAPAIVKALQDSSPNVRRRAALCLGWLGAESDAPHLLPLFRDDHAGVRAAAVEALGTLKFRSAIPPLIQLLEDDDAKVREKANHSLERITGKSFGTPPATKPEAFRKLAKKWQGWWSVS